RRREVDEVTEAGMESFPASDPPAFNAPTEDDGREPDGKRISAEVDEATPTRVPGGTPLDSAEAAGRSAQEAAIQHAMAQANVRLPEQDVHTDARPAWGRAAMYAAVLLLAAVVVW